MLKGIKAIKNLIQFQRILNCRYSFSVLFMEKQHLVSPYDAFIPDIEAEDLKNSISKKLGKQYLSHLNQNEKEV